MSTDQLISKLREAEHPWDGDGLPNEIVSENNVVLELDHDRDKLYTAILKTIPKDVLAGIAHRLSWEPGIAASLVNKIEWLSREHPKSASPHNEPLTTLLKLYLDKRSKRVVYARLHLKDRFHKQSYRDQNRILRAFLNGSNTDCEWACRILRDNWRKELARDIKEAWKKSRKPMLAYVILRHFPNAFILEEQERLAQAATYPHVCARVGNEPSFKMDESRLGVVDYLYVMAKLGRSVDSGDAERRLYSFLLDYDGYYDGCLYPKPSFSSINGWDRMVWAMGVLGMQDALVRLLDFENRVKEEVQSREGNDKTDDYLENKWFRFFAVIKEAIKPEGYSMRFEMEKAGDLAKHNLYSDRENHNDEQCSLDDCAVDGEEEYDEAYYYEKCLKNPFMSLQEEWRLFVDCFYNDKPRLHELLKSAYVTLEDDIHRIIIPVRDKRQADWIMDGPLQEISNSFGTKTTFSETEYRIILRYTDDYGSI